MSPEQTQWMPALVALGIGAVLGIVFLFRSRGSRPAPETAVDAALTLRDLEEEREAIVAQLRDTADLSPEAARDLEIRGARVLRAIDQLTHTRPVNVNGSAAAAPEMKAPASPWVSFAWGIATVLIVSGIAIFVSRSATQKEESAMAPAAMQQPAPGAPSPELTQMEAAVTAQPDNTEMRLALVRQYLMANNLMEVWRHTEYILQRDANNPAGLTYQSIVRAAMGEVDNAIQMNQRALAQDPDFIDAYVQLAVLHSSAGRKPDAEAAIAEAVRRHPEEKQALESILAQIQAQPGT
ncbi:MAG TPA: tetratricopeptide repeat protein [Thermoanaerobaculia bacterium]